MHLIELTQSESRIQLFHMLTQYKSKLAARRCFYLSTHPFGDLASILPNALQQLATHAPFDDRDVLLLDRSNELKLDRKPDAWTSLAQFCARPEAAELRIVFSSQADLGESTSDAGPEMSWLPYQSWPARFALECADKIGAGEFGFDALYTRQARFLCLNATLRTHRHLLIDYIIRSELKEAVSLSNLQMRRSLRWDQLGGDIRRRFPDFAARFPDHGPVPIQPKSIIEDEDIPGFSADHKGWPQPRGMTFPRRAAEQSHVTLVTETAFDGSPKCLTEKTFKPIAYFRPFLIFGSPEALKTLHGFGFESFDAQIDESYDEIRSPNRRMVRLLGEVDRLYEVLSDPARRKHFLDSVREVCAHNQAHLLGGFVEQMNAQTADMFNRILKQPQARHALAPSGHPPS